ncbi:MAG TPA: 30S ribosomal protein S6 [Candidatus Andersenbacteria bacterium]|nr:30S ribosomal protein S6 [Candidatus Andersenbacteria bacterium]
MKQSKYEITYLIDSKLSEEDRGAVESSVDELVATFAGSVGASAPTLRKKLAYDIKRNNSAFLRIMNIELNPAKIADVKDFLKREAKVLRFTILATTERKRVSQEIMDKYSKRTGKDKQEKPEYKKTVKPATVEKEVTMQDVEKGIEEALTEEVK